MSPLWSKLGVAVIVLLAFLALVPALQTGLAVFRRLMKRLRLAGDCSPYRFSGRLRFVVLLAFTVGLVYHGSTKSNGRMAARRLLNEAPVIQTNDVAAAWSATEQAPGYVLAATGTTIAADFAAPASALHLARWVPGGRSDDFMAVPCPFTNLIVGINGTLTTAHRRLDKFPFPVTNALVVAPAFATNGLIPGVSEFWFTTNATARYVWRNIAYERSASNLVSFAVTYCPNRDLIFEYGPAFPSNTLSVLQNGTNILRLTTDRGAVAEPLGFLGVNFLPSNRSYKFSFIADLGDGTADLDADGVSDYNEVMRYGTDPRSADTDQDGLVDGAELAAGTDPRSFDTDADGLADSVDANPTNSNGNCYGQGTNWVAAVYGTNAAAIIAQGYENYVQNTVTNDVNGWWYSFTVTVSNFDDSGHAFIRVGDQAVVLARPVSGAASATFLLEQGRRYDLYVSPVDNVAYAASEPSAVIVPPTAAGAGSVTVAPTGLSIDPSTWHSSVSGGLQSFSAVCRHAHPGLGAWSWTCADPSVHIDAPSNSAVVIRWDWADVSWRATNVVVTCALDDWTFTTNLWISCGTNDTPQVRQGVTGGRTVVLNGDDDDHDSVTDLVESVATAAENDLVPVTYSFSADAATNASIHVGLNGTFTAEARVWLAHDKSSELPTTGADFAITGARAFTKTFWLEGVSPGLGDGGRFDFGLTIGSEFRLASHAFTCVRPVLEVVNNGRYASGGTNYVLNPCGVPVGGIAFFEVSVRPSYFPDGQITWGVTNAVGAIVFPEGNHGRRIMVRGVTEGDVTLTVDIGDYSGNRPQILTRVLAPTVTRVFPFIICDDAGPAVTGTRVMADLAMANELYRQVAMSFVLGAPIQYVTNSAWVNVPSVGDAYPLLAEITAYTNGTQGIEAYYVKGIGDAVGLNTASGLVVARGGISQTLAHEIGHQCGLSDIYVSRRRINGDVINLAENQLSSLRFEDDWNNGTGAYYYQDGTTISNVFARLLMYGVESSGQTDVSNGAIQGLQRAGIESRIRTGLRDFDGTTILSRQPVHQ